MLGQFVNLVTATAPSALVLALIWAWAKPRADTPAAGAVSTPAASARPTTGLLVGLGVGLVAAVGLTLLRDSARLRQRELVSLATLVPLVVVELGLMVLIWSGRGGRRTVVAGVGGLAGLLVFRDLPGVLLNWSAHLLPGQSAWATDSLLRVAGLAGGAALVALAAWALARTAQSQRRLRPLVTVALALVALGQVVTILQLLHGRRIWRLPLAGFRVLVVAINHQSWILYALIGLAAAVAVAGWRAGRRPASEPTARPAQVRLAQAQAISRRRAAQLTLVAAGLLLATVTGLAALDARKPQLSDPEPFDIVDDQAVIPLERLADGHLHRFVRLSATGVEVRFIVILKNASAYGVGFDACEICGPTGYLEQSGQIVCRLCDVVINRATIGYRGGCNPIPLDHVVAGGAVRVKLSDLEAGASHFA
ncbi:MAG: DUF2318 domain-containing protein [Propionibacteriaceae bacterium]|jgi:uncharacterized membrane protein|nr:DUF2318 domain-containing protein [Propionibacteriaceae bacterium]